MRRQLSAVALCCFCLHAFGSDAFSMVSTGAPLLDFPVSARARALGDNGAADNTEPGNIYFNPANVVGAAHAYLQGTRWNIETGLTHDVWIGGLSAGFCHRQDGGITHAGDISYGRLDYGESIATDTEGNILQEFNSAEQSATLTLGIGIPFGEGNEMRLGAAGKRWWANYAPATVGDGSTIDFGAFAFDFGATAAFNAEYSGWQLTPALGAAIVNFGSDIEVEDLGSDPLPTRIHFGGSLCVASPAISILGAQVPLVSLVGNADGAHRFHDQPFTWGMGVELAVTQMIFLRNGFTSDPGDEDGNLENSAWGVGLGIPAERFRLRFDYTHSSRYYEPDIYGIALAWDL